jgi:hypothetical protein
MSCTAEPQYIAECVNSTGAGFFKGVWHGIISPVTLIWQLFSDDVVMYAVNNLGGRYDFGFLLGAGALASRV